MKMGAFCAAILSTFALGQASAAVLAEISGTQGAGSRTSNPMPSFRFGFDNDGTNAANVPLFNQALTATATPVDYVFDASNLGTQFSVFTAAMTDGDADRVFYSVTSTGFGGSSASSSENDLFSLPSGQVDFQGSVITSIVLTVLELTLDQPGRDPNNDGIWTDANLSWRLRINGEPAPSSEVPLPAAALLFGPALVLLGRRRSKA